LLVNARLEIVKRRQRLLREEIGIDLAPIFELVSQKIKILLELFCPMAG